MGFGFVATVEPAKETFTVEHPQLSSSAVSPADKPRWIRLRSTRVCTSIQIHLFHGEERRHHRVTQNKKNCHRRQLECHLRRWRTHERRSHSPMSQIELKNSRRSFVFSITISRFNLLFTFHLHRLTQTRLRGLNGGERGRNGK
jgi:hypothetical protein